MENWLSKVLTDISAKHTISNEKAKNLFEKIFAIIFHIEIANGDLKTLNEGEEQSANIRIN